MTEKQEIITPELVVLESNQPLVKASDAKTLFAAVGPLVDRRNLYAQKAATLVVKTEADAISANDILKAISADTKTALEAIKAHKDAAKARHALWTKFEAFFAEPFAEAKKQINEKLFAWKKDVEAKVAAEQRRLQAIADEKARKEREAAEQAAAKQRAIEEEARRKAEEARRNAEEASVAERKKLLATAEAEERKANAAAAKAEVKAESAAQTIAPTIIIESPKVGIRARTDVVVEITDIVAFVMEAGSRHELCGFIDQDRLAANLKRAKASNKFFKCEGVTFTERLV